MNYLFTFFLVSTCLLTNAQDEETNAVLFGEWNVISTNDSTLILSPTPAELGTNYENWTFRKSGILEIYTQTTSSGTYNTLEYTSEKDGKTITDSVYVEGNSNATLSNTSTFSIVGKTLIIRTNENEDSYRIMNRERKIVLTRVP